MKSILFLLCFFVADAGVEAALFNLKRLDSQADDWLDKNYEEQPYEQVCLNLKTSSLTMSGHSMGGFFSANAMAMFNEQIDGIAIITAGGPCATRNWCTTDTYKSYDSSGIEGKPVYILGGNNDFILKITEIQSAAQWFEEQGADVTAVYKDYGHQYPNALPATPSNPKQSCENGPGMSNCDDDISGTYLSLFYGELNEWNTEDYNSNGQLYVFDQLPFINEDSGMNKYGFIYVPNACNGTDAVACNFHIFIHGCGGTAALMGSQIMRATGLLEHASTNNIVLLFPQNYDPDSQPYPHCWDYARQSDDEHPQIMAIREMTARLYGQDLFTGETKYEVDNCEPFEGVLQIEEEPIDENSSGAMRMGIFVSLASLVSAFYLI